ncbi:DUF2065 domain-containing protein [Marinomonas agarivorans]|nr:DUF2065 domain-containing protein [Marinomonas agarivorans]
MQELLQSLLIGASLLMIFEGILPFISPKLWRQLMHKAIQSSDANLRILGIASMLLGLCLLYFVRD